MWGRSRWGKFRWARIETATRILPPPPVHPSVRVRVWHDDDTAVDLSSRVIAGPSVSTNIDLVDWDLTMTLDNSPMWIRSDLSLDPLDELSTLNLDSSSTLDPLLSENHVVQVDVDQGDGWEVLFQGYAGGDVGSTVVNTKRHTVTFNPHGPTILLKQRNRLNKISYKDRDLATSLLRSILLDSQFAGKLSHIVIADDPCLQVTEYITKEGSTWQALQDAVAKTGYVLAVRYHTVSTAYGDGSGESTPEDGFYLTLYDPQRDKVTPDHIWTHECVRRNVRYSIDDVRTWVRVAYTLADGTQRYTTPVMDEVARAKYGLPAGDGTKLHHRMQLVEDNNSLINTEPEANDYQDFALHDLSSPSPDTAIDIDEFYNAAALHELMEFAFSDYTIQIGITGIEIDLSPDTPRGRTTIKGVIGKVIGLRNYWLGQEMTEEEMAHRRQEWLEGGMKQLSAPIILSKRRYIYQDVEGKSHSAINLHWAKPAEWWFGYTGVFVSIGSKKNYGTEPFLTTRRSYATILPLPVGQEIYVKLRNYPSANMSPQGRR